MQEISDLFGRLCKEYFETGKESELKLELDNGVLMKDFPVSFYVNQSEMRPLERKFLEKVNGRVLDIGCGPGRVGLALRERGLEVLGVDISPSMIQIVKKRKLQAEQMDVNIQLPQGKFDSAVMYGNGLGMVGTPDNLRSILRRLYPIMSDGALIVAESNDPERMQEKIDKDYQDRNIAIGRYIGQKVWRYLSVEMHGPFEYWVQLEPKVLQQFARETGWRISAGPEYEPDGSVGWKWGSYFVELRKR